MGTKQNPSLGLCEQHQKYLNIMVYKPILIAKLIKQFTVLCCQGRKTCQIVHFK